MKPRVLYNPEEVARRVRALGRQISRDFRGQTLDVVGLLDNGFVFMADLVRSLGVPVRCHFIRAQVRDVTDLSTGKPRREIFYAPEVDARDRNVLLVDGVLQSGVTTDFLLRRLALHEPRSLRSAVLLDKPADRRLSLQPDYAAFRLASDQMVVGYGLAWDGLHGNLPYLGTWDKRGALRALPAASPRTRPRRPARRPRRSPRQRR